MAAPAASLIARQGVHLISQGFQQGMVWRCINDYEVSPLQRAPRRLLNPNLGSFTHWASSLTPHLQHTYALPADFSLLKSS